MDLRRFILHMTLMILIRGSDRSDSVILKAGVSSIPYHDFKKMDGDYLPTLGYRVKMCVADWENFYNSTIAIMEKQRQQV